MANRHGAPSPRAARRLAGTCLGLFTLAVASGCGAPAADSGAPAAAGLEVRDARATLMPDTGSVYLTVVNPGSTSDRLLRVETGAARAAETHETVEEDGVMRMVPRPDGFEVPAGGTLALEPGGKHVMLIEPQAPAGAAGEIRLTLHFERAGAIEVAAPFTAMGDMDHSEHGGHDDHGGHATDGGATDHEGH